MLDEDKYSACRPTSKAGAMRDLMDLVADAARRQGITVSSADDRSVWRFHKNGNTLVVPAPEKPVHYMQLRADLTEMGMTWPFLE
jgi:hypothetical protein